MIAKDGEGATKLIEAQVTGARDALEARLVAKKIVGSSLVKTAIFGEDPNWVQLFVQLVTQDRRLILKKIDMWIGNQQLLKQCQPQLFNTKNHERDAGKRNNHYQSRIKYWHRKRESVGM